MWQNFFGFYNYFVCKCFFYFFSIVIYLRILINLIFFWLKKIQLILKGMFQLRVKFRMVMGRLSVFVFVFFFRVYSRDLNIQTSYILIIVLVVDWLFVFFCFLMILVLRIQIQRYFFSLDLISLDFVINIFLRKKKKVFFLFSFYILLRRLFVWFGVEAMLLQV